MKLEWMGEYRDLINHTIRTYNTYAHYYTKRGSFGTEALFSLSEIQVIEYILENEEENLPMVEVARHLGLSASSFSRLVKKLTEEGFLEKYYLNNNRKNIIVKVSDYGKKIYDQYSKHVYENVFKDVFKLYDKIPKKYWPILMEISDWGAYTPPTLEDKVENILEKVQ